MRLTLASTSLTFLGFAFLLSLIATPAHANQIGTISVCYACQDTGDTAIDAALAANPSVAFDGILFAFKNTSAFAITGGVFSLSGTSPADSFVVPTIAAGGEFIFMPGLTSDGGSHSVGGLFASTGFTKDTSDGDGGVTDSSIFGFTGLSDALAVTSLTAGSSTAIAGTFTASDPGLFKTWITPDTGSTSFLGLGPNGDGGCTNCYFGVVATLNTPTASSVPEPGSISLVLTGLGMSSWILRRRTIGKRA